MISIIRRYFLFRKARQRYIILGEAIDAIDKAFERKNISRRERRRFWHEFITSPASRAKFIQDMRKGIK